MTDIVERLRKLFLPSDYFKELCEVRNAAAEIERLRAELEHSRVENEKLQWELGKALDTLVVHDAVCAENEKLREELITSSKKYYDIGYACAKDMANDKVEILSAENKRLERENKKSRVALLRIQCIAQDITRPVPFQEEDDE